MVKKIVCFVFPLILVSCGVSFDNYMPNDQGTLKNMPPELIGKYEFNDSIFGEKPKDLYYNKAYFYNTVNEHDSLVLISGNLVITKKVVAYHFEVEAYYKMSKFDTVRLIDKLKINQRYIQGQYMVFIERTDNKILDLRKKDKLISFDGKLYLNHRQDEKRWDIYQFENIKGAIYSINLTNEEDRDLLRDTAVVAAENVSDTIWKWKEIFPTAHLSNQQFKKFVEQGGFRSRFGLTKIN